MTKKDREDLAHEIWAAAQLLPNEGIVDGVSRIIELLEALEGPPDCNCDMTAAYMAGVERGKHKVREGFVLVPVEPTQEMYEHGCHSVPAYCDNFSKAESAAKDVYRAMIMARSDKGD